MLEELRKAADCIARIEGRRKSEAARVRELAPRTQEMLEPSLIMPLETGNWGRETTKVSAVDGGILNYEMHGADLLIGKAVSSTFVYGGGGLESCSYYPAAFPQPAYDVKTGLDEREVNWHRSIFRLNLEIRNALETARKERPEYLFLDGSVVPLACDKPGEDSALYEDYLLLIKRYRELFGFCAESGVCVAGVVKDSRGKRMMEVLGKHTGERCADTVFLNHMLREGERSCVLHYSSNPKQHAVLKDLGEWGDRVRITYIKPVGGDRPLRVEFLEGVRKYGEVVGVIASLSKINRNYAYPAVLIDADLRAAMDPLELERAKRSLSLFAGPELMQLRRNSRPFR
ncbi:MAG: DNA double-strand break repair nuclease NurA [Candidatus Micrarchaeota archaeon]